jgi:hypothetical protein
MPPKTFTAEIREGRGGGAFVEVPFDVKAAFGSPRPKVSVTFDGEPYRGTITSMGGVSLIGILKDIRQKIGKDIGDNVRVTVEADAEPRAVAVPGDVRAALRKARLEAAFETLSYTHRKEHINAIEEAKRPETRARRIAKMLDALSG